MSFGSQANVSIAKDVRPWIACILFCTAAGFVYGEAAFALPFSDDPLQVLIARDIFWPSVILLPLLMILRWWRVLPAAILLVAWNFTCLITQL